MKREIRDWQRIINRLNATKSGRLRIEMGSPGSAQVTRCRLLAEYRNILATTKGAILHLALKA